MSYRYWILTAISAAFILAFAVHEPIAQDVRYHAFADRQSFLGIPNFFDVVSNLAFLLVGVLGLRAVLEKNRSGTLPLLFPAYATFFAGAILIAFGSAYYHLHPDNQTLLWDRLPMTFAFMAFVAIIVGEHINPLLGRRSLPFLLALGVFSVFYWRFTEMHGRGDLRPYFLVQFLPMTLVPVILLMFPSAFTKVYFLWGTLFAYAAAKILELLDERIYLTLGIVSGHTLKHLMAAAGMYFVVLALRNRSVVTSSESTAEIHADARSPKIREQLK